MVIAAVTRRSSSSSGSSGDVCGGGGGGATVRWWESSCILTLTHTDYARARVFKTCSVDPALIDSSSLAVRPNSRESCGYVNIPGVRIDTYSNRVPVLARKLRAAIGLEDHR